MDVATALTFGFKLVESRPLPTFTKYFAQSKSKVGKRWVKVKKFTGYVPAHPKGQIIVDNVNRVIYANSEEYRKIQQALKDRQHGL